MTIDDHIFVQTTQYNSVLLQQVQLKECYDFCIKMLKEEFKAIIKMYKQTATEKFHQCACVLKEYRMLWCISRDSYISFIIIFINEPLFSISPRKKKEEKPCHFFFVSLQQKYIYNYFHQQLLVTVVMYVDIMTVETTIKDRYHLHICFEASVFIIRV